MHPMDSVFSFPEAARVNFLRSVMQSFGCAYICLWSYSSLSNRLLFFDGFYNVRNNLPSSSVGSIDQRLLNRYRGLAFDVSDDRVPGLAFRNRQSFLELQQFDLLRLAWTDIQRQFFQEAGIKTAVFMGCSNGEIELGFSTMSQGTDIQTHLSNLFSEDFSRQSQPFDQNPPSSSSSSWRSLSTGSPEYSSLLFSIPGTSLFPETLGGVPTTQPVSTTSTTSPRQEAVQALAQVTQSQFPTPEIEHDAIMRAILHVISSPSSTSQYHQPQQNVPCSSVVHPEASAFKRCRPDLGPNITSQMGSKSNFRRQSLLKRSFELYRDLNFMRMRERIPATRPTSTQLHHMISERRRREKLNENFQTLGALLAPGTKKDKASILTRAKETLSSLMAEIEKLSKRNQQLEAQIPAKEASEETNQTGSSNERLIVQITHVPGSSSSEERIIDLQVTARGQSFQVDILIRLLEFLRQVQKVSLISMGSNTHIAEGTATNQVTLRLKIEESEWDEPTFQEAVRRVVADLVQ